MTATVHQLTINSLERLGREIKNLWANSTLEFSKKMIEVGKMLTEARGQFPPSGSGRSAKRPGWHAWIKTETEISPTYASNLIRISEKFGDESTAFTTGKSLRILTLLSSKDVPDAAVAEVVNRISRGERVNRDEVRRIVQRHRPRRRQPQLPTPREANRIARETNSAVLASDHNYYFGATRQAVEEADARREVIYSVREAIETVAGVAANLTPAQWIAFARTWQLLGVEVADIKKAGDWLTKLHEEFRRRRE
jgi:hypothetical protein